MRLSLLIILTTLVFNCFGQVPPDVPPPPPPPNTLTKFDTAVHKPLCKTLLPLVDNECAGELRSVTNSSLHFLLPPVYKADGSVFTKNEFTWVRIQEMPKLFSTIVHYRDSLVSGMKKIKNTSQFTHDIVINGLFCSVLENVDLTYGITNTYLLASYNKVDYIVQMAYDLPDAESKKEMTDFIYSLCFKEVKTIDPFEEISVFIDTSITHFVPQRLAGQTLLFSSQADFAKAAYAVCPKFQLIEVNEKDIPAKDIINNVIESFKGYGIDVEAKGKDNFTSNGIKTEVQKYYAQSKNGIVKMHFYLAVIKTGYSTIGFTGMCADNPELYNNLWKSTIKSMRKKK